jgi:osomolarity two-component system response regulator SSK1
MHQTSLLPNAISPNDHMTFSSSEGEPHTSDGDSGDESTPSPLETEPKTPPPFALNHQSFLRMGFLTGDSKAGHGPSISRTLSTPLPSQLSQLQHPYRPGPSNNFHSSSSVPSSHSFAQISEVSMELADSVQLVIQTMLQISPPQVLDPAKEQFSACALSVPTSSMSAMFTAMKNINYISANMTSFCDHRAEDAISLQDRAKPETMHNEFDIGEMLQCVGDALSGSAAQVGVDLVIYHGDVGLKHVYVSGDESGLGFALTHVKFKPTPLVMLMF